MRARDLPDAVGGVFGHVGKEHLVALAVALRVAHGKMAKFDGDAEGEAGVRWGRGWS